jgi:uncharacterized NAD(P)/FAD-binding protein YdhS
MEIINNYIKWLNKNSTQYEVEEINEEDRALYLRKYKEDFGVFKFCLYCLIPIY